MTKLYALLRDIQTQAQSEGRITIASFPQSPPSTEQVSSPPTAMPSSPPLLAEELDLTIFNHLPPLGHRADYSVPAKHICQSLEYCFTICRGAISPTAAILPVKVAIESFTESGCLRELEWAKKAFAAVGQRGQDVMKQLAWDVKRNTYLP
jgi:hypothetical protein